MGFPHKSQARASSFPPVVPTDPPNQPSNSHSLF
jgi:hypothetical protein